MVEAKLNIYTLVLRGMERDSMKDSRCFLYRPVDKNQRLNRSDPLAKKNAAKSKKGVVGSTGKTVPIAPSPKKKKPKNKYKIFMTTILPKLKYLHYTIS
jgi:hypothetical protein